MQEIKVQGLFGRYGGMASEGRNCSASKDEHLREEHCAAHQTHAAFLSLPRETPMQQAEEQSI